MAAMAVHRSTVDGSISPRRLVFLHLVSLCDIVGRALACVSMHIRRYSDHSHSSHVSVVNRSSVHTWFLWGFSHSLHEKQKA